MADKPLKSITFPGLSDRYTLPTKTSDLTNDSNFLSMRRIEFSYDQQAGGMVCDYTYTELADLIDNHYGETVIVSDTDSRLNCFCSVDPDISRQESDGPITVVMAGVAIDTYSGQPIFTWSQYFIIDSSNHITQTFLDNRYIGEETISSNSTNYGIPTSKAVYDYVQSAIGTAIGGAY